MFGGPNDELADAPAASGVRTRNGGTPFLLPVITGTGLDFHRYICNGWFGTSRYEATTFPVLSSQ